MRILCSPWYDRDMTGLVTPDKTLEPALDNTREPIIRCGEEPFTSYYEVEYYDPMCHVIDPSRSLAAPLVDYIAEPYRSDCLWPWCDVLHHLIVDLGIPTLPTLRAKRMFFHTLFPRGTSDFLSTAHGQSYAMGESNLARVLNHPLFYANPNSSEKRLVTIATELGVHFALDRAKIIPSPTILAREIALLCYGLEAPDRVLPTQTRLTQTITDAFADWALEPTNA